MAIADRIHTLQVYGNLVNNPLLVLQNNDLTINMLPAANDATVQNLWFAASGNGLVIDQSDVLACALAGGRGALMIYPERTEPPAPAHGSPPRRRAGT